MKERMNGLANYAYTLSCAMIILFAPGCSLYHPQPLTTQPKFSQKTSDIIINTPLFPSSVQSISPQKSLDMTTIVMLAVVNNPDLKLLRDDEGIAQAQSFAAGLLPDPQITLNQINPINNGDNKGFDTGLSYDINSLLTYSTRQKTAKTAKLQTHLNVLWQEWQVISQARILFTQIIAQLQQLALLQPCIQTLNLTYERLQQAVTRGDETLVTSSNFLLTLQTLNQQITTLQQQLNQNRHALNDLLALAPETRLPLASTFTVQPLDIAEIHQSLSQLAEHRPDLLALQAGYASQDSKYRQALLEQFPAITVGFTRSNDTQGSKVYGFGVSLNLPIFNVNRGNIAIEKATRQKLHDDYQQRLNVAYSDVYRIIDLQNLLLNHYQQIQAQLPTLRKTERAAELAYREGNMTLMAYSVLQMNLSTTECDVITSNEALAEQRIALQTLLGRWQTPMHTTLEKSMHE